MSNIFSQGHVARISIAKLKTKSIMMAAQHHNERSAERLGRKTGDHVDQRRVSLNTTSVNTMSRSVWQDIVSKVTGKEIIDEKDAAKIAKSDLHYADGKKVRKDAILAFEAEAGYPGDLKWCRFNKEGFVEDVPDTEKITESEIASVESGGKGYFLLPADKKEFEKWKNRTIDFLKEEYGEDNILSVEVHMDEAKPHLHALLTTAYKDEDGVTRFSGKTVLDGKHNLRNFRSLQTTYADRFADMGYVRGEEYSINKAYSNKEEVRAIAAKALQAKLPLDRAEAEQTFKTAITRVAELEMEIRHLRDKGASVKKLIEENKTLRMEQARLESELKELQGERSRRECELMGMKLHNDKEMIETIYKPLQEGLVEDGKYYFKKTFGIDMDLRDASIEESEETETTL